MRDSTDHTSSLPAGGARPTLATNAEETALATALLVKVCERIADLHQFARRGPSAARRVAAELVELEAGRAALEEFLRALREEREALQGLEESLAVLTALAAPAEKWGSA